MGRRVGIIGVGQTHHASKRLDASGVELIAEAVTRALDDSGLDNDQLDAFCVGNMISARLQRRKVPVFAGSAWGMLYGTATLALFAALRGQPFIIEPTVPYLAGLCYLALIASVLAFACYLTLLGRIGVDRAAYVTVMLPVVALAVSTVLEGYRWTMPAGLGLAAVLAGNLLVLRAPRLR